MSPPDLKMPSMLLEKNKRELLIATESMKRLGQSGNDSQLWMCLIRKVKSDSSKNSIALEPGMLESRIEGNWT